MNAMASLKDRATRSRVSESRSRVSSGDRTAEETAARADLRVAFAGFDGTDLAYVAHLSGASLEDMRRVGAI